MDKDRPYELTDVKVGIIGLGKIGTMVVNALKFFGADVYYYSKTRKSKAESDEIKYLPLEELLKKLLDAGTNYHICDYVSNTPKTQVIINHKKTIYTNKICGNSKQSDIRATTQTIKNIKEFLSNK